MLAYFIINTCDTQKMAGTALVLNTMFHNMEINGTADWYYDEFVEDGIEYGVKIEVRGISDSEWRGLLKAVADLCDEQYGDVRVEIG